MNDDAIDDLTEEQLTRLAQRLSGPLQIAAPPDSYLQGRVDPALSRSRPATESSPPNRGRPTRDHAEGIRARDAAWAGMVQRMTQGRR